MQIKLTHLLIENFKGIKHLEIDFGDVTNIYGRNASGKTTISDAFSWLMFDKDSTGSSAFAIRPKDGNGKDVDNIEIKVEAILDVDGEEITLTKVQKQKWTKHRGSTAPTFEGNVNEFQVNGYPAKKNEYEKRIRDLIDENLFKLITNPRTFAAMKWQDQRKTLMEFATDITDEDILNKDISKYDPIRADVLAAGADKAREKAAVTLRSLKKQQDEYPVRIDEAMRNITETMPDAEIESGIAECEAEFDAIHNARESLLKAVSPTAEVQSQIAEKRLKMAEIERTAAYEDAKVNGAAQTEAHNALIALKKAESERNVLANKLSFIEAGMEENQAHIKELSAKYKETASRDFPADQTTCPTCGRPFDSHKILRLKQEFRTRTAKNLEFINQQGKALREKINSQTADVESLKKRIAGLTADIEGLEMKYEQLRAIAEDSPVKTDVTQNPEYIQLKAEIEKLNTKLTPAEDNSAEKAELAARETAAKEKLAKCREELAKIEANKKLQERIEELKEEQRDCSQKVADQEQIVYLLEEFTKEKMDLLSDVINGHFKNVRFRLFNKLINGAITETCTMQINTNGSYVDYSDANNAAKILGGLDVIKALSTLYGVTAPIFLDNAEAIDSHNTPEMDAQLILLEVSDDKELVINRD